MNTAPAGSNPDPYAAPKTNVWMPEVAGAEGPVKAERLTRLGAHLLDSLFFFLSLMTLFLTTVLSAAPTDSSDGAEVTGVAVLGIAIGSLLVLAFCIVQLVLLARSGQTLGKKLLRIRIVRKDGSPASFGRIFGLRILLTWVLGLLPLFSLIDFCFIFGEEKRCVYDLIADTIVVRA